MTYAVRVLCRPEIAGGFALAGLETAPAESLPEATAALDQMLKSPGIGVVLLEQAFHDRLPAETRREMGRRPLPMVVPFAGPSWEETPAAVDSYIVELLRQAIGYRVRLR
ncbi:MAG: V-type ATP synthase subunit F [Gemmatimonadales bacterium]